MTSEREANGRILFVAIKHLLAKIKSLPDNLTEFGKKILMDIASGTQSLNPFQMCIRDRDKERILRALKQANDNRSVAAELLGIGRTTLYSKLEEYGLKYKFKQS